MVSINDLPQELIYAIINYLTWNQFTLASCALVCRSWRLPSQAQRFQHISLFNENEHRLFNRLLTESNHIIPLVHHLCTQFPPLGWMPHDFTPQTTTFLSLTHLRKLELYGSYRMSWDDLSADCRNSITSVLCLPSITDLSMKSWLFQHGNWDIQYLLGQAKTLKSLELVDVGLVRPEDVNEEGGMDDVQGRPPELNFDRGSTLEYLTIVPTSKSSLWQPVLTSFDLSALRGLFVHYDPSDTECISRLLATAAVSLERLIISITAKLYAESIDLSYNLPSLTSITFKIVLQSTLPSWLAQSLATIPASNHISRIVFTLIALSPEADNGNDWIRSWTEIGSVLAYPKFRFLRRIQVKGYGILKESESLSLMNIAQQGLEQSNLTSSRTDHQFHAKVECTMGTEM